MLFAINSKTKIQFYFQFIQKIMKDLKIFRFECFEHFVFIQNFDAIVQFIEFLFFQMNSFDDMSIFKTFFNETKNDEHIVCI